MMLGHNQAKIAHLVQSKIFWEMPAWLIFLSWLYPIMLQSLKKILRADPEIIVGIKLPIWPKRELLGDFTETIFLHLLSPTMLQSLKIILEVDPEI